MRADDVRWPALACAIGESIQPEPGGEAMIESGISVAMRDGTRGGGRLSTGQAGHSSPVLRRRPSINKDLKGPRTRVDHTAAQPGTRHSGSP